jgi:hypothetical protein
MSLYKAETRRLTKRRFTRFLVIGSLLVLVAIAAGIFLTNQKVGPAQVAEAKAAAQKDYQRALAQVATDKQQCLASPTSPPGSCDQLYQPTPDDFSYQGYMPSTFEFAKTFRAMVTALAAIFALMGFVIGASFIGAEWSSGGMMNLLLWRPQRLKVLSTKLSALVINLGLLTAVVLAAWTGIFWLIARAHGTTTGMTAGAWRSLSLTEVRALGLVLVAAAVGFGLASLGRHTATALGVAIGAVILLQFGLVTVLDRANVKFADALLAPYWVQAWMNKSVKIEDWNSCDFSSTQGCQPATLTITWPMAGGVLAVLLVLIVGAAMWTMRSRDVT